MSPASPTAILQMLNDGSCKILISKQKHLKKTSTAKIRTFDLSVIKL